MGNTIGENTRYRKVPSSAHGCSQFKPKKSGAGPYTENLVERLNYLLASTHPQSHSLQVCTA